MTKVECYRNLHTAKKESFSIRQRGIVIGRSPSLVIGNAKFVVRPGGRARVIETGERNVHAFVRGEYLLNGESTAERWTRNHLFSSGYAIREATYNPHKHSTFVDKETGEPLTGTYKYIIMEYGRAYYLTEK